MFKMTNIIIKYYFFLYMVGGIIRFNSFDVFSHTRTTLNQVCLIDTLVYLTITKIAADKKYSQAHTHLAQTRI